MAGNINVDFKNETVELEFKDAHDNVADEPAGATIVFTSDNEAVATVATDPNDHLRGDITPLSPGTAHIGVQITGATAPDGSPFTVDAQLVTVSAGEAAGASLVLSDGTATDPAAGATPDAGPAASSDPSVPAAPGGAGSGAADGGVADPSGGTTPNPRPGAAPSGSAPASAASRAVYTYDGDAAAVDQSLWPKAPVETDSGAPLFYYANDQAPEDHNGDGIGGVWSLYTGATQPAS